MHRIKTYIYQQNDWPDFIWNSENLLPLLGKVRSLQGKLIGSMQSLGFELQSEANLETLTLDVVKSTEIEGEILNPEQVRSSLARRLGMDISGLVYSERNVDGIVDMMLDAIKNYKQPMTLDRLKNWHYAMFPTGRSGAYKIRVGNLRDDLTGPMQVVSGAMGKEKVHFQAPAANLLPDELEKFLKWFNNEKTLDPVIKSGIAHLWFITLHPFEDGNGRMTRALTDMLLTRSDDISQRYYSMSSQIRLEHKEYYNILEKVQKGSLDITDWLHWFLNCLYRSIKASNLLLGKVIFKHKFWIKYADEIKNDRQKKVLNMLMDDFKGKLNTSKWAKINKCSTDTALRDIQDLVEKGILEKEPGGGRSTSYKVRKLTRLRTTL